MYLGRVLRTKETLPDFLLHMRITPPAESAYQPVIQGKFFLSRLWARVLFDSGASHSFISISVVIE